MSFDSQIVSHETTLDTLTAEERAELEAWFDQQQRNAWQDRVDDLQQGEDDYQVQMGEF
jgi:hypothetical protein